MNHPSKLQDYTDLEDIWSKPLLQIFKAKYKGEKRAIKIQTLLDKDNPSNDDAIKLIQRELNISRLAQKSGNDYIMKIYDVDETPAKAYIFSKYYENGTLEDYLKTKGNRRTEKQGLTLFRQLCKGYEWFIENRLIHRDLKLKNIFMDGEKPAIGDFGTCRSLVEKIKPESGQGLKSTMEKTMELSNAEFSSINLSPEQIEEKVAYSTPSDIWALGLILYEVLVGKFPFQVEPNDKGDLNKIDLLNAILKEEFVPPPNNLGLSKEVKELIGQLLKKKPEERITWNNLIKHPLIRESFPNKDMIAAEVCASAIKVIGSSQKEISTRKKKNFLPFGNFLTLIYGLSKIGLRRLQRAVNEYPKLTSKEDQIKLAFEGILKDFALVSLIEVFVNLPDTDDQLIVSLFNDNQRDYEAEFKAWFDRVREEICSAASSPEFRIENKSSYLECIAQIVQILEPSSPSKKPKFTFL